MKRIRAQFVAITLVLSVFVGIQILQALAKNQQTTDKQPQDANQLQAPKEAPMENEQGKIVKPEAEWKKILSSKQYYVLRQKGTERPFTGKYDKFFKPGVYKCAACGNELFVSGDKYNSGCGWPAFSAPSDPNAVAERRDTSHGMIRTEVYCPKCGSHLGHVFNDGPASTGLRYCINSVALDFEKKSDPNEPKESP